MRRDNDLGKAHTKFIPPVKVLSDKKTPWTVPKYISVMIKFAFESKNILIIHIIAVYLKEYYMNIETQKISRRPKKKTKSFPTCDTRIYIYEALYYLYLFMNAL